MTPDRRLAYGSIDPYLVWTVIQQDLGPLQKTALGLLKGLRWVCSKNS